MILVCGEFKLLSYEYSCSLMVYHGVEGRRRVKCERSGVPMELDENEETIGEVMENNER
jgi:hypothetical protein